MDGQSVFIQGNQFGFWMNNYYFVPYQVSFKFNKLIFSKVHYCYFYHCRLVGDNIDHEKFVRVQTKENHNRSIHWTHQYAVLDSRLLQIVLQKC